MADHSLTNKGIFLTRRIISSGSIEIIFTPKVRQQSTLLDGRYKITNTNSWETSTDRGYFLLQSTGRFSNGYGGTMRMTDLDTNLTVTSYTGGKTYKLSITGITSKYLNIIGNKYDFSEAFQGVIHSVKVTGSQCGYGGTEGVNAGKSSHVYLQPTKVANGFTKTNRLDNLHGLSEQSVVGAVASSGWTLSGNTWRQTGGSGWGKRLFIMKTAEASDGQRTYERLLRLRFTANIPSGKYLHLYYNLPDGGHAHTPVVSGPNDIIILIESSAKDTDAERPKFDSDNGQNCTITNLIITEYHGALLQGHDWSNVRV